LNKQDFGDYYLAVNVQQIITHKNFRNLIRGIPNFDRKLYLKKRCSSTEIEAQNDDPIEDRYLYISPQDWLCKSNQIENKKSK